MQNAHLRMGKLHFSHSTSKRSTDISVLLDRMILEREEGKDVPGQLHLMSVLGTDVEISAINAALSKDAAFRIEAGDDEYAGFMAAQPERFRGTISVQGRSRPLRHLLALSAEIADFSTSNPPKVYLLDSSPQFVWTSVAYIYGLPGRPEWADWFYRRLEQEKHLMPLLGIGCDPVCVVGERDLFLEWLGEGRTTGELDFPRSNGPILWPSIKLPDLLGINPNIP